MVSANASMLIDAVDQADKAIGTIRRAEVFRKRANFRVAHDLIFNSKGQLLIQQIASGPKRHPGYWGSSVAAYLYAGESYEAAANRRLVEELGVQNVELQYFGKTPMMDQGCFKFIAVFTGTSDGPFDFDQTQIAKLEFLSISRLHEIIATRSRSFTPTFLEVLRFYESRM